MKQRSTTPVSRPRLAVTAVIVAAVVLSAVVAPITARPQTAAADVYDQKIAAIQAQIDQYQTQASQLAQEADSLQNKIAGLQAQQSVIQAQINETQVKHDQLVSQIAANEKKIADNKSALGDTLASLYVDGSTTPLEMLASSDNIGDYVDKQTNREAMRDSLVQKITDIKTAQEELAKQKVAAENTIKDQEAQKAQLVAKQGEISQLLSETQGKEDAYNQLSAQGKAQQNDLRTQQQAAIAAALAARNNGGGGASNVVAGDPGHGGYPAYLDNAGQDTLVDPWGMYNRECVSYVAWKVFQKNGYMPYWGGRGNAKDWPSNARGAGIATGSTPKVGSAGVIYAGPFGHIVWVNSINSNGTINISQYNYGYPSGRYSEAYNVSPSAYDVYIYF